MKTVHLAIHPPSHPLSFGGHVARLAAAAQGVAATLCPKTRWRCRCCLRALARWQAVPVHAALFAAITPTLFAPPHWLAADWDEQGPEQAAGRAAERAGGTPAATAAMPGGSAA